jgi:hypothetical protein
MRSPNPPADFEEDLVDCFPFGNGAIDDFIVNVVFNHDVLRGAGSFFGTGYIERGQLSQKTKDMSGDFQHVSIHTTH